jgi:imidazolonepropionase-like amidohydrolase
MKSIVLILLFTSMQVTAFATYSPTPDISHATLVMADERIFAVGPADQVTVPAGVEVIDLDGVTILPGFVNAHVRGLENELVTLWRIFPSSVATR